MNHLRSLGPIAFAAAVAVLASFNPKLNASEEEGKVFEKMHTAKTADELATVYGELFTDASNERLTRLKMHRHTGIALQAAWEAVRRTFPKHVSQDQNDKKNNTQIKPEVMAHFLGFVEGRLRVCPPKWWKEGMIDTGYDDDSKNIIARKILWIPRPDDFYSLGAGDVPTGPAGTSVVKRRDGLNISVGRDKIELSNKVSERVMVYFNSKDTEIGIGGLSSLFIVPVAIDSERFVVAFHAGIGCYPLLCVSRTTGKILWETSVFGASWLSSGGLGGGIPESPVGIQVADGVIYIFGFGPHSAYIEAFSLTDGKNLFRFSTSY